jgi:light-regulated signal transduction histidine kinase (bacteriophytochrome)
VNFRTAESSVEISVDYEEMKTDSINHKNVMDISGMKNQQFGDYNKEESIELILSRSITNLHGGNLLVEHSQGDRIKFVLSLPCKKNDSIYYLYSKECPIAADNLLTMINIEFSDLINSGWN